MSETAQSSLFIKSFLQGLGAVCLLYVLLFGAAYFFGNNHIAEIESQLSSKIVKIIDAGHLPSKAQKAAKPAPEPLQNIQSEPDSSTNTHASETRAPVEPHQPHAENVETAAPFAQNQPLAQAPIANIYQSVDQGLLPKVSTSGLTPFEAYKKPFSLPPSKPAIAIILLDYGLSEKDAKTALEKLPGVVSLGLSPFSPDPEEMQKQARQDGHEIWLSVPFESRAFSPDDSGPMTMLSFDTLSSNRQKLEWLLSRTPGYTGIIGSIDEIFMASRPMAESLLRSSFKRGLGYLELNKQDDSFSQNFAAENSAPFVQASQHRTYITSETLERLEKEALASGQAVLAVSLSGGTVKILHEWITGLPDKNIVVAPLSALTQTAS